MNNSDNDQEINGEPIDIENVKLRIYRYPEAILVFLYFLNTLRKNGMFTEANKSHVWAMAKWAVNQATFLGSVKYQFHVTEIDDPN